jgi:hypothetical protein
MFFFNLEIFCAIILKRLHLFNIKTHKNQENAGTLTSSVTALGYEGFPPE